MSNVQQFPKDAPPDFRLRPLSGIIRHALFASAGALFVQGATIEQAQAGPQGGNVTAGQGQINTPDSTTTVVQQQSHSLVVNWQTFNVAKNEVVQFNQPSASASVLNRVLHQTPSQIFGSVNANGKVFLLNPSGVVIGKSARVNVGSLFMSSLNISDDDFMNGKYQFAKKDGSPAGAIINRGLIQAATGGSVTLVGDQVSNEGVIVADAGHVNLAAGRTATVDFNGDGLIHFEVDGGVLEKAFGADAAVTNSGEIHAEGGQVLLTASTASQVFDRAVNNSGLIQAGSIQKVGGKVTLSGFGGGVVNSGAIDASGASGGDVRVVSDSVVEQFGTARADGSSGDGGLVHLASVDTTLVGGDSLTSVRSDAGRGGLVEALGDRVGLVGNARVDASGATGGGTALIGGGYQGANPEVQNATRTYVAEGASIDVSATERGNGGTAIVWADEITRFYGTITGRGGARGGDGAFAEVSGLSHLTFQGRVDLGSVDGKTGTLLLDPDVIEIVGGTGDGDDDTDMTAAFLGHDAGSNVAGSIAFADEQNGGADASFVVTEEEIETQSTTASIILDARDAIIVSGTFNHDGDGAGSDDLGTNVVLIGGGNSLTLRTRNGTGDEGTTGIDLTAAGTLNALEFKATGAGSITVETGSDGAGAGGQLCVAGCDITLGKLTTTGTGSIAVSAGNDVAATTGAVNANGALTSGGSINIDAKGAVTVATGVTVATSDIAAGDSAGIVIGTDAGTRIGGALTLTGTAQLRTGMAAVTDVATVQTGSISVFASGAVDGSGTMVTGVASGTDTAADATDVTATSGTIVVDSSADIAQLDATTGAANIDSTTDTDAAAISGLVTLTGAGIGTTAAAAVTIGAAGDANANTNETQGTLSLTSTGADAVGNITATMATELSLGTVSNVSVTTAGTAQTIDLSAPTLSIVSGGFNVGADHLVLRTTAGAIDDGTGGAGGNLLTAAILALSATADIDVSTATGSIAVTSTGATDAIFIENTGALNLNDAADALGLVAGDAIVSNDGDITVFATGGSLTVTEDIAAGTASIALTTTGGTSHIIGAGGTVSTTDGVTGLVLNAGGGVGVGGALHTALSGTGLLAVTTGGTTTDGNVTVVEANALPIANVTVATDVSAQTISLTASTGDVTLGAASIGDGVDDLSLTSTLGQVAGGAGVATANVLSLSAATGIGASAALSTVADSIGAATTAGNIDIDNAFGTTTTVTALTTAGASTINFDQMGAGGLSLNGAVTTGAGSTATLTSVTDINRLGGTVTAGSVALSAASGIGNTGALDTAAAAISAATTAGNIDIDNALATTTTVSALTTSTAGTINFDQTGLGDASFATVTSDGAGTVTLTSQSGLTLTGTLGTGSGDVGLNADSDNVNTGGGELSPLNFGAGTITTTGALSLTAFTFGSVGSILGPPSSSALTFTRNANLTLGDDAGGAPSLSDAAMDTFTTAVGGTLVLSTGGGIVLDRAATANGNLTLTAGTAIAGNGMAVAWDNATGALLLNAGTGIGTLSTAAQSIGAATTTGNIDIDNALGATTTVTALSTAGAGTVNFDQMGAGGLSLNGDVTTGTATLTSATDINRLGGTLTAGMVSLSAASGIGNSGALSTAAGTISAATTAGNIDIDNALATTTSVTALTTSTEGTINFDQNGLGDASFGTVTTDGAGTVTLNAQSGLTLTGALSTGSGNVGLNADSDNVDSGGGELGPLNFGAGTITTRGALSLTAFTFGTVGSISGPPSSSALTFTRNANLTLGDDAGGGPSMTDAVMDTFTTQLGGTLALSTGGSIVLDRATAANGNLTLTAGTTIAGNGAAIAWSNPTGTLLLNTGTGIGPLNTSVRSIGAVTATGNIDINNGPGATTSVTALTTSGAGLISFDQLGAGSLSLNGNVGTDTGTVTLTSAASLNRVSGTVTANAVSLSAGSGLGSAGAIETRTTGNLSLSSASGNIRVNDDGIASTIAGLTLAAGGGGQTITLGGPITVDSDLAFGGSVNAGNTLVLSGAANVNSNIATGGYSLTFDNAVPVTLGAGVSNISTGAGSLGVQAGVTSPAGPLTLTAGTTNLGGAIAMTAGSPLTIASALNLTSKTLLTTDALTLGGAVTGSDLTILRTTSADAELGGADPIFSQANLNQFTAYTGTLSLGGERTVVPGSSANLLGNVEVSGLLKTAGDIFIAGAGDINFDNTAAGVGRVESTKSGGVVSIAALGSSSVNGSGSITDTGVFSSIANPGRAAVAVGSSGTIELLANNQIGSETGGGAKFNLSAPSLSVAQGGDGEAQVDNAVFGALNTQSVQEILVAYSAPGLSISSFIGSGLRGAVLQNLIQTPSSTPKQDKGELGFIDEGVFLLPSTFTYPERAILMPILGDPDFPSDQRPEDPDAEDEWLAFFEGVVREYIASRHLLAENATSEERAAVEAIVTSELQAIITFYKAVRERERRQLVAGEIDAQQPQPDGNSDTEQQSNQQPDAPASAAPLQQGALPVDGKTLGYIGRPWSAGGIGFEVRG